MLLIGILQPNWFNSDANIGHAFGIFMAYVGISGTSMLRRQLTKALGSPENCHQSAGQNGMRLKMLANLLTFRHNV